jgi:hypothetical protein
MTFDEESDSWIRRLDDELRRATEWAIPERYELVSSLEVERFGGHEMVFARTDDTVTRYVTIAVLPRDVGAAEPSCRVEIWVGADDGSRFGRQLAGARVGFGVAGVLRAAEAMIGSAFERADSLRPADLDASFISASLDTRG